MPSAFTDVGRAYVVSVPAALRGYELEDGTKIQADVGFGTEKLAYLAFDKFVHAHGHEIETECKRILQAMIPAMAFDEWIANSDRRSSDLFVNLEDHSLWLIDHARALASGDWRNLQQHKTHSYSNMLADRVALYVRLYELRPFRNQLQLIAEKVRALDVSKIVGESDALAFLSVQQANAIHDFLVARQDTLFDLMEKRFGITP